MTRTARTYEACLTLHNGTDVVVEGRPGSCPDEADDWTILSVETDERHPVPVELDDDGEERARAAPVERWTEAHAEDDAPGVAAADERVTEWIERRAW